MTQIFQSEEKQLDHNIGLLKEYQTESDKIYQDYKQYIFSKNNSNNNNCNQRNAIQAKISQFTNKINAFTVKTTKITVNLDIFGVIKKQEFKQWSPTKMKQNGWELSVCGLRDKIKYDKKTFHSKSISIHQINDCFARTDIPMSSNSFVYKIKWKIDESRGINNCNIYNAVGICTDAMVYGGVNVYNARWKGKLYHVGWHSRGKSCHTPNGLECGNSNRNNNLFQTLPICW